MDEDNKENKLRVKTMLEVLEVLEEMFNLEVGMA